MVFAGDLKSFLLARRRLVDQQGAPEVRHDIPYARHMGYRDANVFSILSRKSFANSVGVIGLD